MSTCTIKDYTESVESIEERIARYKVIRTALEVNFIDFVADAGVQVHKLNDGQVVIETQYRSTTEYLDGIKRIDQMINILTQNITGGLSYSKPHSSFDKQ